MQAGGLGCYVHLCGECVQTEKVSGNCLVIHKASGVGLQTDRVRKLSSFTK